MNNINFSDGCKEYTINNDSNKVIRFNPSDIGIVDRMAKVLKSIECIGEDMKSEGSVFGTDEETTDLEKAGEIVVGYDNKIREQIDYLLGNPVCAIAFGEQSCLSTVGGKPLYERFLDALMPIIKKDVELEQKASQKRVEKYTKAVKSKC